MLSDENTAPDVDESSASVSVGVARIESVGRGVDAVAELGALVGISEGILVGSTDGIVGLAVVGSTDGARVVGAEVGIAYGSGAVDGHPMHSNDEAPLVEMAKRSQLPEAHVTEHGAFGAHGS